MPTNITHDVLYARETPDDVEPRGVITRDDAIELFRTFPFATELASRRLNPELTAPTITFAAESSGDALAIWSEVDGRYVIWFPSEFTSAENVSDPGAVEKCICLFFDRPTEELSELIRNLGSE